jgi:hypothetical protein
VSSPDALTSALGRISDAFGRFGITVKPGTPQQNQWRGDHDGRSWDAWLGARRKFVYFGDIRTRRTIGYRLHVETSTAVMMRMFVLRRGFATNFLVRRFHRRGGLVLMPEAPAGLEPFRVVTCDADWVSRLLARPEAARLVASLVEYRRGYGECADILFLPGQLHYSSTQLQLPDISTEHVASIVTRLGALAREAEQVSPPANPAAASNTTDTSKVVWMVAGLFAGALALLAVAALLLVALATAAYLWLG